uniref:BHLH domain-containing protein n=1 Tax=Leersia perrieri TaxID=77586 RepID=A0A0D9WQH8_9ORYZ
MQGDPGYGYGGYGYGYGYGGYGGGGGYPDMAGYGSGGGYYTSDSYTAAAAPAAYEDPLTGGLRQHDFPAPLTGLEFQPSDTCPKNYVIFDQTYDRSRVMFHPSLANNFGNSGGGGGYDHHHCYGFDQDYAGGKSAYYGVEEDDGGGCSIRQKEDTDEIDALMSTEDGEEEDDVLSTGRTPGCRAGGSPDSTCSSGYGVSTGASRSDCCGGRKVDGGGERKKERMKKMMRTLKGIIPGGDRMDTPAVLDEAVRYLKSLKVEVKKLGVRGSSS